MPDTNEGRVTLARIDERLTHVIENQERDRFMFAQRFDVLEQKTGDLQRQLAQANAVSAACMARQEERHRAHAEVHEELSTKKSSGVADIVSTIAAVAAAFGLDALTRP